MNASQEPLALRGMTWGHSRGVDGLVALGAEIQKTFGVTISWESRSLLAFGDQHISDFAADYDFLVIDHPHVPDAATAEAVLPLDKWLPESVIQRLALESVGESHNSYIYNEHIWAFAIDAAAQVSVSRAGGIPVPPYWDDVLRDARAGKVIWPHKPVDLYSTFATMMAQKEKALLRRDEILHRETATEVLGTLIELASHMPTECSNYNPIDVAEILATTSDYEYCPALYGYTNYSRVGYRKSLLQYEDVVSFDGRASGSQLGGAGIAVSSATNHPKLASEIAAFFSMAHAQSGEYTTGGGQPGNLRAWLSPELNELTNNFFRYTLRSLEKAWVRPRVLGYPDYQLAFSLVLHKVIVERTLTPATLTELESLAEIHLREKL